MTVALPVPMRPAPRPVRFRPSREQLRSLGHEAQGAKRHRTASCLRRKGGQTLRPCWWERGCCCWGNRMVLPREAKLELPGGPAVPLLVEWCLPGSGEASGELLLNGGRVQFRKMEKFWRCGGDDCTTMWVHLMPLNCTLRRIEVVDSCTF